MKKRYKYSSKRDLDGLYWTARVMDFGVSLTNMAALNELTTAYVLLRDRRDICRHAVKKAANDAMDTAARRRQAMFSVMSSRDFFDTYSDKVIDLAERDITMFRIGVKQTLDDHHVKNSELFSYMETARTLLGMAEVQFKASLDTAGKDFGTDYAKVFCEFNVGDVAASWSRVCDMVYSSECDVDLNTDRNTAMFRSMARKFSDGDYIDECMKSATGEFPEFKNKISIVNHGEDNREQKEGVGEKENTRTA